MLSYVERVVCQFYSISFSVKGLTSPYRNWHKTQNRALPQGSEILEETAFLRSFTGKERNLFLGRLFWVNSLCYFLQSRSHSLDPPSRHIMVRSCLLSRKTVLNLPHKVFLFQVLLTVISLILSSWLLLTDFEKCINTQLPKVWFQILLETRLQFNRNDEKLKIFFP